MRNEEEERGVSMTNFGDESFSLSTNKDTGKRDVVRSSWIQIVSMVLIIILFGLLIIIIGVASASYDKLDEIANKELTTTYYSLGLPQYEGYSWADVCDQAAGSEINFYMWSGDDSINDWVDTWLAPQLLDNYDITLTRVSANAVDVVSSTKAIVENGWNNGTVDLVWINGANFYELKSNNLAYGPWAKKVPSADVYNFEDASIEYDFGYPTAGYEMPYTGAQVIFVYDIGERAVSTINSIKKIIDLIMNDQLSFTYAAPCYTIDRETGMMINGDHTGSVFMRHVFYYAIDKKLDTTNGYLEFMDDIEVDETLYAQVAPAFFKMLRDLEPHLYYDYSKYKKSKDYPTGSNVVKNVYPTSNSIVDDMFGNNDTDIQISYNPSYTELMVDASSWNTTSQGYVLTEGSTAGTIANTNFVAIPITSKNMLAAVVAGNFIGSPQAMYARANVNFLNQVYDTTSETFTTGGWNVPFDLTPHDLHNPTQTELSKDRLGELPSVYINRLETDWYYCVLTYVPGRSLITYDDGATHTLYCE